MGLTAYLARNFEHTHEREMFDKLISKLNPVFQGSEAVIIGNFFCGGENIDAALFKGDAITVIELKDYSGKIEGGEEGIWKADNDQINKGREKNPFQQVHDYKFAILGKLNEKKLEIFGKQKSTLIGLGHISGVVVFRRDVEYDRMNNMPRSTLPWFYVTDLNQCAKQISQITSPKLRLTPKELERIIKILGLEKSMLYQKDYQTIVEKPRTEIEEKTHNGDIIRRIANLSKEDIGNSEEDVKIKFIVPFLEALGHTRMDFEHKYKDIILRRNLPRDCYVIVETKKYGANLDRYLEQLERYCNEERPLLGVITNGDEVRVYSPFWRGHFFKEALIYSFRRSRLDEDSVVDKFMEILHRKNLETGKAKENVISREKEIDKINKEIKSIRKGYQEQIESLNEQIKKFQVRTEEIQREIRDTTIQIENLEKEKDLEIRKRFEEVLLPLREIEKTKRIKTPIKRITTPERTEIYDLIKEGVIESGLKIFKQFMGQLYEAKILPNGQIRTIRDGTEWSSLSSAANHLTGSSINGWIWWRYKDAYGNEYSMDNFRKKVTRPTHVSRAYVSKQKLKKSWADYVREALVKLGGQAHLSEIYREVDVLRRRNGEREVEYPDSAIRNALEVNSRGRGKNYFEPIRIGSGMWKLK